MKIKKIIAAMKKDLFICDIEEIYQSLPDDEKAIADKLTEIWRLVTDHEEAMAEASGK